MYLFSLRSMISEEFNQWSINFLCSYISCYLCFNSGYKGCFGAKEINETCNSCEDIVTAYENKGWHWDVTKFDVCMKGI